jgi:hypothetical protein
MMQHDKTIRDIFVIHKAGLPMAHVGIGQIEIDDALLGGLLSAISNVGITLGLSEDGSVDTIAFRSYNMIYAGTPNSLVVLLSSAESPEFYVMARNELQDIGDQLESRGLLDDPSTQSSEKLAEINDIIEESAREIFAAENDVFMWNDSHSFRLAKGRNERWNGLNLMRNYLLLSPMVQALAIPMDDLIRLCDILKEMQRPSEILNDSQLTVKDTRIVEDTLRFLHMYGIVECYSSSIADRDQ